jgi:chromosome segregation ATPase
MTDLDDDLESLLLTLDRNPKTTSEIRDDIGKNQNGQIIYAIDERLPDGLVEQVGTERHPGRDAKVWGLTADGQLWVDEHREEMERPADLPEVVEAVEEVEKGLSRLDGRCGSLRQDLSDLEERVGEGPEPDVDELRDRVDATIDQFNEVIPAVQDELNSLGERLDHLERGERIETLGREVEDIGQRVATVEERVTGLEENGRVERLAERVDAVEETVGSVEGVSDVAGDARDTAAAAEETASEARRVAAEAASSAADADDGVSRALAGLKDLDDDVDRLRGLVVVLGVLNVAVLAALVVMAI